jgi:hypothetical protein
MATGWGVFAILCRYIRFHQMFTGTGEPEDYLVGLGLLVAFISSACLSLLSWVASEDADTEKKELELRTATEKKKLEIGTARAEEIAKAAKRDLQYKEQLLRLIGKVVELKADHALEQLNKKKADSAYMVVPYDPWAQIEKILETVVGFFGELVIEESNRSDAEVFGAYFTQEGDYLTCKFSTASRDPAWNVGDINTRYMERFDLRIRPAPSAAVFAAVESASSLYMIEDCEAAHADPTNRFQYFEQTREQAKNKSMMCYVVRDAKDRDRLRGEFCVYTNVKGFFDNGNPRIRELCENFMREMAQRVIYEYRQLDLT